MAEVPREEHDSGESAESTEPGGGTPQAERPSAERGAESYGGDEDAAPSVTEDEVERGLKRDQAEG